MSKEERGRYLEANTAPSLVIRDANEADWRQIQAWADFSLCEDTGFVGMINGIVIAYLQWHPHHNGEASAFIISRLEVRSDVQFLGYGRRMVQHVQAQPAVRSLVAASVLLEAVSFWEKVGFVPDGWNTDEGEAGHYLWQGTPPLSQKGGTNGWER